MRASIRSWLLAVAFVTAAAFGVPPRDVSAQELKIATIAPDGSGWMREMRAGAERIRAATNGRVVFRFYPGGVMGDDAQVLRRIRIGQLHGGAFTVGGLAERYPALNLYGIPLLFHSAEEVDYVREKLDPVLIAGLREAGFVSFGFVESGFARLMSSTPIRTVDDMRRRKIWIPEGDVISAMSLEVMGLSPVVLPITDVLTGLQTGLLDVVASTPVGALVMQWHTKVGYVTDLPVLYSMGVFALDARAFGGLSESDRRVVTEIMTEIVESLDRAARRDSGEALDAMLRTGIEPVAVDPGQVAGWRSQIETIYPALRERPDTDREFLDRLLGLLHEYRRGAR